MFVGTYEHSLDGKGRVVLPVSFRNALPSGYLSQYQGAVGLWTADEFKQMSDRLIARARAGEIHQNAVRAFAADASEVRPDTQGRIMVPPHLREYAGLDLEAEVAIIGAIDRIELWNADTWRATHAEATSSYRAAVDDHGI